MRTYFTKKFKKAYQKRISTNKSLAQKFKSCYDLFADDPTNESIKDHELTGKLEGSRAFSITGSVRVVYHIDNGIAYFIDVGTHNQVYGKRKKN